MYVGRKCGWKMDECNRRVGKEDGSLDGRWMEGCERRMNCGGMGWGE